MLKELAEIYGCDISKPATNVKEATQAVHFSYLAAVKEQNGAAPEPNMSCVSSMRSGKKTQFFGARAYLAKFLLYAINGGVDEMTGKQVGSKYRPITSGYLDYDEVWAAYKDMMKWLASVYVNALRCLFSRLSDVLSVLPQSGYPAHRRWTGNECVFFCIRKSS